MLKVPFLYLSNLLTLITTPRYWKVLLVPLIVGLVSYPLWVSLFVVNRAGLSGLITHSDTAWIHTLTEWLVVAFGTIFSAILSFFTANIVGIFALEKLADELIGLNELREKKDLESPAAKRGTPFFLRRKKGEFVVSIFRAVGESLLQLVVIAFLGIVSLILAWIPIVSVVAIILAAFLLGMGFLDLPFSRLDWSWRQRWRTIMDNKLATTLLGALFMLISLIPLGAVIFLALPYMVAIGLLKFWATKNN